MHRATLITTQCAWCRKIKVGGRYMRLDLTVILHEIDLPGKCGKVVHYEVSHGICEACKERLLARTVAA